MRIRIAGVAVLVLLGAGLLSRITDHAGMPPKKTDRVLVEIRAEEKLSATETVDIERMSLLGDKLGPMLLQFPKFDKWVLKSSDDFVARLGLFLKRAPNPARRFAVEIRHKNWLDVGLADLLREHNVAFSLTDTSFTPRPWEMKEKVRPGYSGLRLCSLAWRPQGD